MMLIFIEIKSLNPKVKQSEIAIELGCSSSILKRYKNDINKLPTYRIPPNNTNTRKHKT